MTIEDGTVVNTTDTSEISEGCGTVNFNGETQPIFQLMPCQYDAYYICEKGTNTMTYDLILSLKICWGTAL